MKSMTWLSHRGVRTIVFVAAICSVVVGSLKAVAGQLDVIVTVPVWQGAAGLSLLMLVLMTAAMWSRIRYRAMENRTREQVREAERLKHRQFLRRLDHEMKNPLTAVRAVIADLAREANPQEHDRLDVIDTQARRMSSLVTDLRKLAELETAPLAMEDVDLTETVRDAVEAASEKTNQGSVAVPVRMDLPQVPWPLPHVRGDADLLYCAIDNLVGNAIKYTSPGGVVEIRGSDVGGVVTIEVSDTGMGVPHEEMETILSELGRASNARGFPGSGLGLALVRTIVDRHGGDLQMSSRLGVGTRVWMSLPVAGPVDHLDVAGLRHRGDKAATTHP